MSVHPFQGERMSHEHTLRFWDDYAEQYSSVQQGDIPSQVVGRLSELGVISQDSSVLELGSGPGTYSLLLAPRVRELTCMDTSPRMLARLVGSAESMGIDNLGTMLQDWTTYVPDGTFDTCMASLCPNTGTPESIRRMEAASSGWCVTVSWLENHGDDLSADVWKWLGKDYGYEGRRSTATQDWLEDNGRDPAVEYFESRIRLDIPVEALVEKERTAFRAYGVAEDVGDIVRDILSPVDDGGVVHFDHVNRMRMVCWRSL